MNLPHVVMLMVMMLKLLLHRGTFVASMKSEFVILTHTGNETTTLRSSSIHGYYRYNHTATNWLVTKPIIPIRTNHILYHCRPKPAFVVSQPLLGLSGSLRMLSLKLLRWDNNLALVNVQVGYLLLLNIRLLIVCTTESHASNSWPHIALSAPYFC